MLTAKSCNDDFTRNHCVMQGKGAYNRTAVVQMTLVDYTAHLLERHMTRFVAAMAPAPCMTLRIADLGASEGRNSVALISLLLQQLEAALPTDIDREYMVFHEDLPENDFDSLLATVNSPASYAHATPHVYTSVIAKSFYERLVPANSIDIFVSYISLHWLSIIPVTLPGNYMALNAPTRAALPDVYARWKAQGHADWVRFLRLRGVELADNGVMCITMAGYADNVIQTAWADVVPRALAECVRLGTLSQVSMDKMTLGGYLRTCDEVRAGVAEVPEFELHECEMIDMPLAVPSAQAGAAFMVATTTPSVVAAMSDVERTDPAFHAMFEAQLALQFDRLVTIDGVSKPIYAHLAMRYLYCALSRRPRIECKAV
ncbi:SAM dependent carboxyl methyltransferase [Achlya hypogyna]|uniref:SAM dependent carboxyl methyltransferase n=1 Tax=Achlya hypogyna TaxID=1202772 RepID=A0A1V9ZU42_ACHHY|nr:SAM dependent carboxyl methyltransferase [Achlya hypogyna]